MRHLLGLLFSLMLTSGLAVQNGAAAPLDPLTVSFLGSSETSIQFEVQAGASGAPNGVWLEWVARAEYDANGWGGYAVYCTFTGTPTYNVAGTSLTYQLGANETVLLEVGDVFDETGMWANYTGELSDGTEYVARAFAMAGDGLDAGPWTADVFHTTLTSPAFDCIHTQGYWKNHEEAWPVSSLTLGTVLYTQAQLLSILNTPAQGNGLIFLAHQLISAKLNVANGANAPGTVSTAIANADALIGSLVIPPIGGGYLSPGAASALNDELDSFNNGTGGGNCDPVPTEAVTWGQIKSIYTQDN